MDEKEETAPVRALGVNHIALEVDSVDRALEWWGQFFEFELRGRRERMAWIDLGDQFLALTEPRVGPPDRGRHFGLVVDGKERLRSRLAAAGLEVPGSGSLRFRDPWGNSIEVVEYRDIQFTKAPEVLRGMGIPSLEKSERAQAELREKGMGSG